MKVLGVIPSRFGSTRFPGKPLAMVAGQPLLQWVIEGASRCSKLSGLLVATDDPRIADLAGKLGVEAVMTSSDLPSGSDRVWAAIQGHACDVVLNIQGDEPLIGPEPLEALIQVFEDQPSVEMATLGRPMTEEALNSNTTAKIVLNQNDEALYFSRFAVPYSRGLTSVTHYVCLKHVGIYAYRRAFLQKFCQTPPTELELAEGLEQLRALYLGAKIKVVRTDYESWGVDTPEDVLKVEMKLKGQK